MRQLRTDYISNSLSLSKLAVLLGIGNGRDRRNRMTLPPHNRSDVQMILPPPPNRDPVAWDSVKSAAAIPESLSDAVKAFVGGRINSNEFRSVLSRRGVQIVPELDRLIRRHDADNSRAFSEFARVLIRLGVLEITGPGADGPSLPTGPDRPINTTRGKKNLQSDYRILTWN
jgi:hypothetical protein